MRSLLVINPNTSTAVTALLRQHVQAEAGEALKVHAVTARFGAPYISSEAAYAVAHHTVLDAWAYARAQGFAADAVLIGCFGDPGLFALREGAGVPVSGLAEAAFAAAAMHGRFAIVTGGERWRPMLERLAGALGYGARLAGVHTVAPTGAQLAADPVGARVLLTEACREAADRFDDVDAVILGGASLAGMGAEIAAGVPVPLIDSVQAGARWAVGAAHRAPGSDGSAQTAGFGVPWQNVSWELEALE